MMNIVIKETGKREVLELLDRASGTDSVVDVIGNWNALDQFEYDAENGVYACSQDTYDWWAPIIAKHQELNDRIAELSDEHGSDRVAEALSCVDYNDLDDHINASIQTLEEAFPEVTSGN